MCDCLHYLGCAFVTYHKIEITTLNEIINILDVTLKSN